MALDPTEKHCLVTDSSNDVARTAASPDHHTQHTMDGDQRCIEDRCEEHTPGNEDRSTCPLSNQLSAPKNRLCEKMVDQGKEDHAPATANVTSGIQVLTPAAATTAVLGVGANTEEPEPRILVRWDDNDPRNPFNWSVTYKSWIMFQLGMLALAGSLGSSIISPASEVLAQELGTDLETNVLNVSLYVVGFAVGPLLWAPLSEVFGRRVSMIPAMTALALLSIGTATSHSAAAIFITRFFGGVFGSAPISNVVAALGDIWTREVRGTAVSLYAICVVGGPTLGPTIGAALVVNHNLGWRWTEYILAIWVFAVTFLAFFCLPEIYGPVLLKRKAVDLRKDTGNDRYFHPQEDVKIDIQSIITKQLTRPLLMLVTEPIVTCIALYASFVYAILYLTLEAFPIVFQQLRHYRLVVSTLPFLGLFIGVNCALVINLGNQPRYIRKCREAKGQPVPEARLPPMAIGAVLFVVGLFLFGWTAPAHYSWVLPSLGAVFIGAGFNSIFQQCLNFLVDVYGQYAASATAANTFLRSLLSCGLPLAVRPMFFAMGVGPAMSVMGAVAAAALPVPFVFMKYGHALRRRSKFAPMPKET
ncbi:hypothetical protein A1O1_08582 [Capronia coronata CBS 617.96]|uniref:Major facilitator superfamily (MFS) profile domain-containing protein n=1 Tax=Capronia coronata CBS 617.96 TaxID=1182541 RepID=W9XIW1_9EURO|nr:uncharacterized protein A1O1_08582 [Capronia coronata CBS 617.96]EXJ80437.1 hypothetical protein A1O1_08582 [Capronia coronata CBS 617.96]